MGRVQAAAMIVIPGAAVAAGWYFVSIWAWLAAAALLLVFVVVAGRQIVGLWRGALVDQRNKVSLSQFQTLLWTVVVVSALLAAAFHNIRTAQADPLNIDVPPELWILLGISASSLVGSGLIKQQKAETTPEPATARLALSKSADVAPDQITAVGNQLIAADDRVLAKGVLAVNHEPGQSSWLDMFRAEEVGSIGRLDLGKVQMFYFTIIIVFAYSFALGALFVNTTGKIVGFPPLSQSVIVLLGISHAAYLTNKAVPRTPVA